MSSQCAAVVQARIGHVAYRDPAGPSGAISPFSAANKAAPARLVTSIFV